MREHSSYHDRTSDTGDVIRANGLKHAELHRDRRVLTLPGYFRPTKLWDLLVVQEGRLIAALEFKSHVGPSFGRTYAPPKNSALTALSANDGSNM